jgi:hypothetical protein
MNRFRLSYSRSHQNIPNAAKFTSKRASRLSSKLGKAKDEWSSDFSEFRIDAWWLGLPDAASSWV